MKFPKYKQHSHRHVGMKDKLIQATNDTLGTSERSAIRSEILQFTEEINDIVEETKFNKSLGN